MQNLRPLVLNHDVPNTTSRESWLKNQSKEIQAVTSIEDEQLVQRPCIETGAYVDPTAQLIGGILVRRGCYIGPYAVVRLDEKTSPEPLVLGEGSNLQDGSVVHAPTTHIGSRVIVAHQAIVHGAVIEDNVTLYIQAVADGGGTIVGRGCFLHQGAYVGKGIRVAPNRFIDAGRKVLTQSDADRLPEVPPEIRALSEHVLESNDSHVRRYLAMSGV
jgi:carbonic anhydrase/acetyltransferase-like protein (isoleucine patch superfamily)